MLPATNDRIVFIDTGCRKPFRRGRDTSSGGTHAGMTLDVACKLANKSAIDAIVTAPISKQSLNLAGYKFNGHTEMFAKKLHAPDCQMVMTYRDLRVVPLTRHIPVKQISRALTQKRIVDSLVVLNRALRDEYGIAKPRIAVSGLNPHAGDSGLLGREEIEIIEPALRLVRRRRIDVTGPVPGDSLFQYVGSGTFDAFVTMYHDQGLIPFKMTARRRGVNVTVGLPVVRTSVDHGVAYDIAGKGIASTASLKAAYRLAEKLARRRIMARHKR